MTIAATQIWEIEQNGSDTLNGGGFDPSATPTRAADLAGSSANTSAPVVSSATYNFAAGDVGAWVFIKSGTNWTPGWYKIASVASNQATLSAAIGAGVLYITTSPAASPTAMSTAAGCATTASPTAGTWSIDYSQQSTAAYSLTGLTTSAANATISSTSANKAMVGNSIQITGGTNFTTGIYTIITVTAGTSFVVDRTCCSAAASAGTCGIGGAFATPGKCASVAVASNILFIKYSASVYAVTSATTNIAAGCVSFGINNIWLVGYSTNRFLGNTDSSMPTIQAQGSTASVAVLSCTGTGITIKNLIIDGGSLTGLRGMTVSSFSVVFNCIVINCPNSAFVNAGSSCLISYCLAYNCPTLNVYSWATGNIQYCAAINCSGATAFVTTGVCTDCVASGCSIGFLTGAGFTINCTAYNNTAHGFQCNATSNSGYLNCLAYGNGGMGFSYNSKNATMIQYCVSANNTSNNIDPGFAVQNNNNTSLTVNPFVNSSYSFSSSSTLPNVWAAFALTNTPGGGLVCRGSAIVPWGDIGATQHQDVGFSARGLHVTNSGLY